MVPPPGPVVGMGPPGHPGHHLRDHPPGTDDAITPPHIFDQLLLVEKSRMKFSRNLLKAFLSNDIVLNDFLLRILKYFGNYAHMKIYGFFYVYV